jgi:hypothetical protein
MADHLGLEELLERAALAADTVTSYRGVIRLYRDRGRHDAAFREHRRLNPSTHRSFDDPPKLAPTGQPFVGVFAIACRLPGLPFTRHLAGHDWVGTSGPPGGPLRQQRFVGHLGRGQAASAITLLSGCHVDVLGTGVVASRRTVRLELQFRPSPLHPTGHFDWEGADVRLLDIDEETGLALRCEDRFQDAPIEVCEFASIEIGVELGVDDLRTDLRVLSPTEVLPAKQVSSVSDAASLVDYVLLVPSRVPFGCVAHCVVQPNATRIDYTATDGRLWLAIVVESSSGSIRDDLSRFDKIGSGDDIIYLWESSPERSGRTLAIVERGGSRARLRSDLGRDALIEVARSLRPYG